VSGGASRMPAWGCPRKLVSGESTNAPASVQAVAGSANGEAELDEAEGLRLSG